VISDLGIWRAANLVIRQHGDECREWSEAYDRGGVAFVANLRYYDANPYWEINALDWARGERASSAGAANQHLQRRHL